MTGPEPPVPGGREHPVPGGDDDPTLVRNQPALRSGSRRWWYVWTGLFAAVAVGTLAWLLTRQPGVAITGIVVVVALYAAMLIVGGVVRDVRRRNLTFAAILGAIAVVSLGCAVIIMSLEWM